MLLPPLLRQHTPKLMIAEDDGFWRLQFLSERRPSQPPCGAVGACVNTGMSDGVQGVGCAPGADGSQSLGSAFCFRDPALPASASSCSYPRSSGGLRRTTCCSEQTLFPWLKPPRSDCLPSWEVASILAVVSQDRAAWSLCVWEESVCHESCQTPASSFKLAQF